MPAKKFAAKSIPVNNWEEIMVTNDGFDTTITVHLSNHSDSDAKVSLAILEQSTLQVVNHDVFQLNQLVYKGDSRQFPGIVLEAGHKLMATSSYPGVTILVYGYEEEI